MQHLTRDQQEVEWQFDALDVRPVGRWLENGVGEDLVIVAGESREISDTYLDTEDWRIYQAGYALRIRRVEGKNKVEATMMLLASEGDAPGLCSQREISEPLESAEPGAFDDDSGPVGKRISALAGPKKLRTLFEIQTHRNTFGLILEGLEVGEVALDETNIPLENDAEPTHVRRVEVEVEPNAVLRLEPFVERLRDACRLSPATASIFEAGLFARGLTPPRPPEFGTTGVDDSLTAGELAFRVLREQFAVFLAHEPGTRIGEDPEELHDMRVAARRMRAAMKIFEMPLPVRAQRFRNEFKWIAGALGEVRDLDVQLARLDSWISSTSSGDREPLEALRAVFQERRKKARRSMLRRLNSRRYARLVESFGAFLERGPSRRAHASRRPILAAAPDLVRKPYRKMRKLGDPLTEESSGEEYHELRKKGKRLRYALEFLSDIYGDPAKDLIKPLKELQDVLGDHQDAEVAGAHLRELAASRGRSPKLSPETTFVMGGVAHRYEVQARELRAEFPGAYSRVRGKRWKRVRRTLEQARPKEETR
jgi:CHAD domain-containing protein